MCQTESLSCELIFESGRSNSIFSAWRIVFRRGSHQMTGGYAPMTGPMSPKGEHNCTFSWRAKTLIEY